MKLTGISLGSNLGDRVAHLMAGRAAINAIPGTRVTAHSRLYATEPVDVRPEHQSLPFLNACLLVQTTLTPEALAAHLHRIENACGRNRTADPHAPRTLDLDLLFVDDRCIQTPDLTVPHPRWSSRRFVVQPLADLCPDRILPGDPRTVTGVLLSLPDRPVVVLFKPDW